MKLLIAADIFPPESGGPATYCVALANALFDDKINVRIVSLTPHSDKSKVKCKINAVWFKNKLLRYVNYFILLFIYSFDVDIIYAMGPINAGWPALKISKLLGKKLVVKIVGDYAWEQGVQRFGIKDMIDDFQKKDDYHPKIIFLRKKQKEVVQGSDRVITPSWYLKSMVSHQWGAGEKKVEVIYNAMKFINVPPIPKPFGEHWIVSVGRLVPWKGMDTLIKIMPKILKFIPGSKLKIVGDGPEMKKLEKLIVDNELRASVELLGNLSHEQTLAYIHAADKFVLNSAYEGLSHVILEALNFRRLVFVSSIPGNKEIVFRNLTGHLFNYNDEGDMVWKILGREGYLSSKVLNASLGEEFFCKFKFEKMISETKRILEEIKNN